MKRTMALALLMLGLGTASTASAQDGFDINYMDVVRGRATARRRPQNRALVRRTVLLAGSARPAGARLRIMVRGHVQRRRSAAHTDCPRRWLDADATGRAVRRNSRLAKGVPVPIGRTSASNP